MGLTTLGKPSRYNAGPSAGGFFNLTLSTVGAGSFSTVEPSWASWDG